MSSPFIAFPFLQFYSSYANRELNHQKLTLTPKSIFSFSSEHRDKSKLMFSFAVNIVQTKAYIVNYKQPKRLNYMHEYNQAFISADWNLWCFLNPSHEAFTFSIDLHVEPHSTGDERVIEHVL